jgi:hypothetical protein
VSIALLVHTATSRLTIESTGRVQEKPSKVVAVLRNKCIPVGSHACNKKEAHTISTMNHVGVTVLFLRALYRCKQASIAVEKQLQTIAPGRSGPTAEVASCCRNKFGLLMSRRLV